MANTIDIEVPDLTGRRAIVTGGSDGIGLHIVTRLARAGADVVMPVRDTTKGRAAAERIRSVVPGANLDVREMDLASLSSIASFADGLLDDGRPIGILVNNAGVMNPPTRRLTQDGFELQFGTNHLGHVALTGRLLHLLQDGRANVTTQVSVAADQGSVNWDDLQWETRYDPMRAYSSSKIALGLFATELDRRSADEGWGIRSNLSHPGVTPTNLLSAQPQLGRTQDTTAVRFIRALSRRGILFGTPESAALAAVHAATGPDAAGGRLYGPSGFQHLRGLPAEQRLYSRLANAADAGRIWDLSERLVGVDLVA